MRINRITTDIPKNKTKQSQDYNKININNNIRTKNNPTFKGGLDSFCLGVADLIENGGLAISFTFQDMLGTNLPRPIMGLRRNTKENKGEKNLKFAAKELVREMLTGPSMFLIPMGMLGVGKRIIGKTIDVPMKFIKSFGEIHAAQAINEAGEAISKQDFYKNTFAQIIKNAKSETEVSKETIETAANFAERLAKTAKDKVAQKETLSKLSDEFIGIVKNHAKDAAHTDFTTAVVTPNTSAPIKDTINYMMSYADDIVAKAQKQDVGKINEFIKNIANKKVIGRFAMNAAMYSAIMAFLQIIPRLYNKAEGKSNAGLKGLMKEETLKYKTLNETTAKNTEEKATKDKSNPSFGSAATITNTLTNTKGIIGKIAQTIEFEGCNVSFPLLLGIMGFGILIPRTLQAKDKYDREEILRRDLVTCATMCFAEKELRKGFSKLNETKSGLVLAAKDKGFKQQSFAKKLFDYLRPIKGVQVLSTEQIISKYSGVDKYKDGIKGFCEFIEGQGGNLGKVFSVTDEAKNIVQKLLAKEGKDIATADNTTIKDTLTKAIDSDDVKKLTDLFRDKNNPWVQKAKTLNARFTALSVLVLVPVFLGFLLPAINERATKKRIREEENQKNLNMKNNINTLSPEFFNQNQKTKNIFADMAKYTK